MRFIRDRLHKPLKSTFPTDQPFFVQERNEKITRIGKEKLCVTVIF